MKGKDLHIFIRFGGLNLKKQKGYSNIPKSFHAPPAPRGFYAMPKVAQEFFLIGSLEKTQPGIFPKEKPAPEEYTWEEKEAYWNKQSKDKKVKLSSIRREFTKSAGEVWHHLIDFVPHNEITDRHGSWVKTSIGVWKKAFSKHSIQCRYGEKREGFDTSTNSINNPLCSRLFGVYSKDHLEVFFDEKV
jgi:hypothetical protein